MKFKWIALGHKLSSGEGGKLAHLCTKLTHPTRELHKGKKKLKVQLMGKATDSFFSVSQVAPIPFYNPTAPIPLSHYCNVNKIGAGNVAI